MIKLYEAALAVHRWMGGIRSHEGYPGMPGMAD